MPPTIASSSDDRKVRDWFFPFCQVYCHALTKFSLHSMGTAISQYPDWIWTRHCTHLEAVINSEQQQQQQDKRLIFPLLSKFIVTLSNKIQLNTNLGTQWEQPYLSPQTESGPALTHISKPPSIASSNNGSKVRDWFPPFFQVYCHTIKNIFQLKMIHEKSHISVHKLNLDLPPHTSRCHQQ
jgi:hypothetical protein